MHTANDNYYIEQVNYYSVLHNIVGSCNVHRRSVNAVASLLIKYRAAGDAHDILGFGFIKSATGNIITTVASSSGPSF